MTVRTTMRVTSPERSTPRWLADFKDRHFLMESGSQIDRTKYYPRGTVTVTVGTGGAAQGATSLPVAAPGLEADLESGRTLDGGGGLFARLSAPGTAGDTSLTVAALPTAVPAGTVMRANSISGAVAIPSGTVVSRSTAERDANQPFHPPTDADAATGEVRILVYDVVDANEDDDIVMVRPGASVQIRWNYLPEYTNLSTAVKNRLATDYLLLKGVD
jgi:hypothetical protein